jgi:hypothetical protein
MIGFQLFYRIITAFTGKLPNSDKERAMQSKRSEGRLFVNMKTRNGLLPGFLVCLGLSLFAAALLVVVTPSTSMGQAGYLTEVQTAYDGIGPGVTGTDRDECFFCHFTGNGAQERNNFGVSVYLFSRIKGRGGSTAGIAAALADPDFTSLDLDYDGITTADENIAGTQPGLPDHDGDGYVQYSYRGAGKGIVWYATAISDNMKGSAVLPPDADIDDGDAAQGRSPAAGWSDQDNMTAENVGTTTDNTPPPAITDLGCSATTADSVTLTWTPPGSDEHHNDIRYTTPSKAAAFTCPNSGVACDPTLAADWLDMWEMADNVITGASGGDGGSWNNGSSTPLVRVFWAPHAGEVGDGTMVVEPTGITSDSVEGTTIGLSAGWRPWSVRLSTFAGGENVYFAIRTDDGVLITDFADDATSHSYEGISGLSNIFNLALGGGACSGGGTTDVTDGSLPPNSASNGSDTDVLLSTFDIATSAGSDTVTAVAITRSGTGADADISAVKLYRDDGTTADQWDASDTLLDTQTFSGGNATFSPLSESVGVTAIRYLITFDVVASPGTDGTHTTWVTGITATNSGSNADDVYQRSDRLCYGNWCHVLYQAGFRH